MTVRWINVYQNAVTLSGLSKLSYNYFVVHLQSWYISMVSFIEDGIALFFVVSLFKPIWWWWKNIGHFLLKFGLTFLKHFWLFVYNHECMIITPPPPPPFHYQHKFFEEEMTFCDDVVLNRVTTNLTITKHSKTSTKHISYKCALRVSDWFTTQIIMYSRKHPSDHIEN